MTRNTLHGDYRDIIGNSPQMFEVLQQIGRFAATSMRILISGETGTSKGMVARALHQNSNRSGELVSVFTYKPDSTTYNLPSKKNGVSDDPES